MDDLHGATWATVLVALFVLLNNALTIWHSWRSSRQRSRIERKVEKAVEQTNGHPLNPGC